jgi:cleavage and polyadenylation specificity factor subunit 2
MDDGQIFVHGSSEDTDHLATQCYENPAMTDEVYAPSIGDVLDVSSATNLFKVIFVLFWLGNTFWR